MISLAERALSSQKRGHSGIVGVFRELLVNKHLYLMMLPGIIWFIIFCYVPLYGITVAFKKYDFGLGITGSPWNGLDNFEFLFTYDGIGRVFFNTIYLNVIFLVTTTLISVVLAIMFSEIKWKPLKRVTQSIAILPHFVSWAVVSLVLQAFVGTNGLINQMFKSLGMARINFYNTPEAWPLIFVILRIWQGCGYGTVVYIAAITGFDTSMYEAARVDGATRMQQIWYITLPLLKPTVVILTIMGVGGIFRGDFGMIYAMVGDNAKLFSTTDVIDTFVYRAMRQLNDLGMSTATSVFQSVVGCLLVLGTNAVARKLDSDTALF